jgi:hypothetical protein
LSSDLSKAESERELLLGSSAFGTEGGRKPSTDGAMTRTLLFSPSS